MHNRYSTPNIKDLHRSISNRVFLRHALAHTVQLQVSAHTRAFATGKHQTARNIKIYRPFSCFACLLSHSLR